MATYTVYIGRDGYFWRYIQSVCTSFATVNRGANTYSSDVATKPKTSSEVLKLAAGEFPISISFSGKWRTQQNAAVRLWFADANDYSNNRYDLGTLREDTATSGNMSRFNLTKDMTKLNGKTLALYKDTSITSGEGWGFILGTTSTPMVTVTIKTVTKPTVSAGSIITKTQMDTLKDYQTHRGKSPTAVTQYDTAKASVANTYGKSTVTAGSTIIDDSWYNG